MEVKQSEVTQAHWDEWNNLKLNQECAECGGRLDVRTIPERQSLVFGCAAHPTAGFRQRTSYTEDHRRGAAVPLVIQNKIDAKLMVKTELNRAMNLLQVRFPDAIKDIAGAALFINDCMRLGLDPLIQPAEAVPIAFKTKGKDSKEKWTVAMIISEDGYLSMAARGCPDEYDSAPATMPLLDYLMREHTQRPMVELQEVAKRTARELCDDPDAFVWVALGKRRSATEIYPVYGYYRQAEWAKAKENRLPAGTQPGNQARVRAVKRWVRETFPECRQKMLEYTAEILRRSEGAIEARRWIDAEYRVIIDTTDKTSPLISPPGDQKALARSKAARTQKAKKADNKVGESAQRSPGSEDGQGGDKIKAAPSGADEHTLLSDQESPEIAAAGEATAVPFDWLWLKDIQKQLGWKERTTTSFIKSLFNDINDTGILKTVLPQLNRDQLAKFTRSLNEQAGKPKLL